MHATLFIPGIRTYSIYDVYKINKNSREVEIVKFGDWNTATALTVAEENIWKRRSNLKGHHLRYLIRGNVSMIQIILHLIPKIPKCYLFMNIDLITVLLRLLVHRLQRILRMVVKLQIVSKESLLTHFINYKMK